MTPNKHIFCNAPWYELHIYWDGSLGFCCQESHKLYSEAATNKYNLKSMTIQQWYDSEPMRQARLSMLGDKKNTFCSRCYNEEQVNESSRRHRSNQKSVIFTKNNFDESLQQSPHFDIFKRSNIDGNHDQMPVDFHIDLGNYCNLTCKMCGPSASSSIAVQHVKWSLPNASKYVGTDWTRDETVWNRTLEEIVAISKIKNIHFMGGETLLTKRFENFIDYFIQAKRFDVGFSFVTNGTTFNQSLLNKLKKFRRVGIEISIETATEHNSYQRQGTNNSIVFDNVHKYLEQCNGINVTVTIRPAISALTIGYYHTLLQFCLDKKLIVKSLICTSPAYYNPTILPADVKFQYLQKYLELNKQHFNNVADISEDFNESDPNEYLRSIKQQVDQCINLLQTPPPENQNLLLADMVAWCKKWDNVHGYNARLLYPEFSDILDQHGY